MTRPTTVFDRCLERFKREMRWSPQAGETEKTLVLGNLNGFTALLNKMLLETSDAEILAAVPSDDLLDAKNIKNAALVSDVPRLRAENEILREALRLAQQDLTTALYHITRQMTDDPTEQFWTIEALRWDVVMVKAKDKQEALERAIRAPGVIQLGQSVKPAK